MTYMEKLGCMKRIDDLRSIWPHEEQDFSKWLAQKENLEQLSDAIEIDLELEKTESPVGSFSVDIYARESGSSRGIIIENQLEDTDHDHLGKIIMYAAGKDAEIIVWIVKRARDEHEQAIGWLNQHTDENIGFFLMILQRRAHPLKKRPASSKKAGRKRWWDSSLPVMRPWRPFPIWTDGKEFKIIGSLSSRYAFTHVALELDFFKTGPFR